MSELSDGDGEIMGEAKQQPLCNHYNLHPRCPGCAPGIALLPANVLRRYLR